MPATLTLAVKPPALAFSACTRTHTLNDVQQSSTLNTENSWCFLSLQGNFFVNIP